MSAAAAANALCCGFDWFSFCTSSARMKGKAGPLQKLLHLANAREALASGDPVLALNEVDAALAADASFAAAHTLRADIIARMSAAVAPSSVTSVVTIPVAVPSVISVPAAVEAPAAPSATTAAPEAAPIDPPIGGVPPSVGDPRVAPMKRQQQRRASSAQRTGVVVTLGMFVMISGVGIALLASGLLVRAPRPAPQTAAKPAAAARPPAASVAVRSSALTTDVRLPAPARPVAAATVVPAKPAVASESNGIDWASPRLARLNVHPRWRASAVDVEDTALLRDLGQGISELWVGKLTGNEDAIFVGGRLDENGWRTLRSSMKPTGVVWRIYSHRSTSAADSATITTAAAMAGFARVKQVRYSADYVAEQFTMRRPSR